jgi:YHS domain-containing protein
MAMAITGCSETEEPPQAIEESFESVLADPEAEFSPLQYADGTFTLNDRCPISRDKLNPKVRPLFVNQEPVGFCSPMCPVGFSDGPDGYLERLEIELASFMDETKPAVLDAEHRTFVNYEIYFFADAGELTEFEKDPLQYCGLLTDPVSKKRFQPGKSSPTLTFRGQPYYFLTAENRSAFIAKPSTYALPQFGMLASGKGETGKKKT